MRRLFILLTLTLTTAGEGGTDLSARWHPGEAGDASFTLKLDFLEVNAAAMPGKQAVYSWYSLEERYRESVHAGEDGKPPWIERTYVKYEFRRGAENVAKSLKWPKRKKHDPVRGETTRFRLEEARLVPLRKKDAAAFPVLRQAGARSRWECLLPDKPVSTGDLWTVPKKELVGLLGTEAQGRIVKAFAGGQIEGFTKHRGRKAAKITVHLVVTLRDVMDGLVEITCPGTMLFDLENRKAVELDLQGGATLHRGKRKIVGTAKIRSTYRVTKRGTERGS